MSFAFEIGVIAFLVILNGWFAMSEIAIVSSRRALLAVKASKGGKGAQLALTLADNPGRFLSSVQIGITLVGILAGVYSGAALTDRLAQWIVETIPSLAPFSGVAAMAVVVGLVTYASLVVGELVPKQIALANPEGIAALVARPVTVIARIGAPVVWILERSCQLFLRLLSVKNLSGSRVTEEEVRAMIAEGTETGVFEPQEKELFSGVMRFADRKIRAIMTPRNDVVWIDLAWDEARILKTVRESPHSRFPVCEGGLAKVLGVVQAKDLLDAALDGRALDVAAAVRPFQVVPESAPAVYTLDILRRARIHMALVVDEYGSVEGIVTATDILSAIIGNLTEHGEDYDGAILLREDGSWLLDGDVAADVAAERIGCRIMEDDDSDYTTVAGFILSRARSIPSAGDVFVWDGWRFEVVDMDGRRIDKVLISKDTVSM